MATAHDRWLRIITALGAREGPEPTPAGMCSAAADLLAAGGVGLLVMAEGVPGAAFASNRMAEALEELQFTLGTGPRVDAHTFGVPIIECDLDAIPERWVGFCGPAVEAGTGAVFSFPLRIGAARLGAFTVYQLGSGPLQGGVYADAVVLADVATRALLAAQAGLPAGSLAAGLADEGSFAARVHQASGMVSAQLEVGVGEALARLRARAFVDGTPLAAVAGEVVARRLRFDVR
ncbi:MAG: ANTAR domain-containing protein [Acidimicrobiales bacterium]